MENNAILIQCNLGTELDGILYSYLLPLCRSLQLEQCNIVNQSGVVEPRVDDNIGDVELFVSKRLGGRADVILAQPDFEDVTDGPNEG